MIVDCNCNGKLYGLNIERITQLCGLDVIKKDEIIKALVKYFGKKKYSEFEVLNEILIDGNAVGRTYFDTYLITRREDIIDYIKLKKGSVMYQYLIRTLTDFNFQQMIDDVENQIGDLYKNMSEKTIYDFANLRLDWDISDIIDPVKIASIVMEDCRPIEFMSNNDLVKNFIKLIEKMLFFDSKRTMIIFQDVDHMLYFDEYLSLVNWAKKLTKEFDLYFVFSSSVDGYAYIDDTTVCGINVVNEGVYIMPQLYRIKDFVNDNYPCHIRLEDADIPKYLLSKVHMIGQDNYSLASKADVILKLINNSMMVNAYKNEPINKLELAFLNGEYSI